MAKRTLLDSILINGFIASLQNLTSAEVDQVREALDGAPKAARAEAKSAQKSDRKKADKAAKKADKKKADKAAKKAEKAAKKAAKKAEEEGEVIHAVSVYADPENSRTLVEILDCLDHEATVSALSEALPDEGKRAFEPDDDDPEECYFFIAGWSTDSEKVAKYLALRLKKADEEIDDWTITVEPDDAD